LGKAEAFGPDPQWPKRAAFSVLSATSRLVPSNATRRIPASQAPRVPGTAIGTAARSNNNRTGSAPSRCLACPGTFQTRSHEDRATSSPTSLRITSS
jgi:hypothetical protein